MKVLYVRNRCWWSPQESYIPIEELSSRQTIMVLSLFGVKRLEELHEGMKDEDENFITTIEELEEIPG